MAHHGLRAPDELHRSGLAANASRISSLVAHKPHKQTHDPQSSTKDPSSTKKSASHNCQRVVCIAMCVRHTNGTSATHHGASVRVENSEPCHMPSSSTRNFFAHTADRMLGPPHQAAKGAHNLLENSEIGGAFLPHL